MLEIQGLQIWLRHMNKDRWDKLLVTLGIEAERQTYDSLINAYSETHRAYHNATHINACLVGLDNCELSLQQVSELEIAFWFHDAIYKIHSRTNEEDSAAWAVRFLQQENVDAGVVSRINQYILDTKHNAKTNSLESAVVVDIDLGILGTEPEVYADFETAIAREYHIVPKMIFRKKRKAVLESFLRRESVYQTDYYQALYEKQARANLQQAIEQLS